MKRNVSLDDVCAKIDRWERRQRRAINALKRLYLQRRRLEQKAKLTAAAKVSPKTVEPVKASNAALASAMNDSGAFAPFVCVPGGPDDDIPAFLKREAVKAKDAEAAAKVKAEQEAEKKRKAELAKERRAVKQETVEAELTGKRKKMPLQGRAALAAIRD